MEDELPNYGFDKASAIVFDEIDHVKAGILPSSIFFTETLVGGGFIMRSCWVSCIM